jgi:hypothetical protein
MSYCRFIEADAYIYNDVYHGLYCCACALMPVRKADMSIFLGEEDDGEWLINEGFAAGYDYDKMLAHVADHRAAGDYIPEDVDERLVFERDCKHDYNSEGICKHCWGRIGK